MLNQVIFSTITSVMGHIDIDSFASSDNAQCVMETGKKPICS